MDDEQKGKIGYDRFYNTGFMDYTFVIEICLHVPT